MSAAIEAEALHVQLGGKSILQDITVSIEVGSCAAIVGPNGAGKSTLLRSLLGLIAPARRAVRVLGRAINSYGSRDLARKVAYVPQRLEAMPAFTVRQMVLLGRYPHLSPFTAIHDDDEREAESALKRVDAGELADRDVNTLSGGERQKVMIAAALAQKAELLLLDEPTTFLDYPHQQEVRDLICDLHDQGLTILFVTHDVNTAALTADRVIALREGQVVFDGCSSDLMREATLELIYGRPFTLATHPRTGMPMVVPDAGARSV